MEDREFIEKLYAQYKCPIWRTKKGEFIPLTIMAERHMTNCYRLVCKNLEEGEYAYSMIYDSIWGLDPDSMAYEAATQEEDQWYERIHPMLKAWVAAFEAEFKRRGLPIPGRKEVQKLPKVKSVTYYEHARIIALDKGEGHNE